MKKQHLLIIFCLAALLPACATVPTDPQALVAYKENNDPLEPMNRKIFAFNLGADKYVMHPIARGYRTITTAPFRFKVRTFYSNLKTPLTIVNDILQLNFKNAGLDTSRFIINSTLGFFGVFDVADRMGIPSNSQGFGTTMGVWNIPSGPYLVLPLLGPSNIRDTTGLLADTFLDPITYSTYAKDTNDDITRFMLGADVLSAFASYENAMDLLDDARKSSLDFYAYSRSLYRQLRASKIEKTKGISSDEPKKASYEFSFDDEMDNDDE